MDFIPLINNHGEGAVKELRQSPGLKPRVTRCARAFGSRFLPNRFLHLGQEAWFYRGIVKRFWCRGVASVKFCSNGF